MQGCEEKEGVLLLWERALTLFYENDTELFVAGAQERTIAGKIAMYMDRVYPKFFQMSGLVIDIEYGQQNGRKEDIMKAIRWLLKLVLVMITLPLILAVWLAKWFVVFLHHCSAWFFYLLGSVLLVTAMLSFLMQQSQGMEALQMLIGGFVIFMIPQVVGSVIVLLELAAVMLRQAWYI